MIGYMDENRCSRCNSSKVRVRKEELPLAGWYDLVAVCAVCRLEHSRTRTCDEIQQLRKDIDRLPICRVRAEKIYRLTQLMMLGGIFSGEQSA